MKRPLGLWFVDADEVKQISKKPVKSISSAANIDVRKYACVISVDMVDFRVPCRYKPPIE